MRNVARPAAVATDGWSGYAGIETAGYTHDPLNLSAAWGDADRELAGDRGSDATVAVSSSDANERP